MRGLPSGPATDPAHHGLQSSRKYATRRDEVFTLFPRLAERQQQRAGTLSGGEQQMVAIARGLMSDPDILIIDELSLASLRSSSTSCS